MRPGHAPLAALLVASAVALAGCGIAANSSPVAVPAASVGPAAGVSAAVAQTRGVIAQTLESVSSVRIQFGDATRPYRPAESPRLRGAPRAVYQVVIPNRPDAGFIVVYQFADAAAAVDAGNEEAGYLGTGPAKVQFPLDAQHVIRQLGPTLILYSWSPSLAADASVEADIGAALSTLGIGFSVPR
jgi:hypothetical protein